MRKRLSPKYDLSKQTFGYLTVIEMVRSENPKVRGFISKVMCKCGTTKLVSSHHLLNGRTTSCGCRRDQYLKNTGKNNKTYTGHEEIRGKLWDKFKIGALRRGYKWQLTMEEAWTKFLSQNRKCALSGLSLSFGRSGKSEEQTASIDRIDNSKDYSIDNIQWVHKKINIMRNKLSIQEFQEMCKLVTNHTA